MSNEPGPILRNLDDTIIDCPLTRGDIDALMDSLRTTINVLNRHANSLKREYSLYREAAQVERRSQKLRDLLRKLDDSRTE